MGQIDIVKRIEKIFANQNNFDISGFARPELVTPEIADALAYLTYDQWRTMCDLGYEFFWFNTNQDDGIISKWFEGKQKGARYSLRLYYNQTFPKEIAKGANEDGLHDRPGEGDSAD